MFSTDQVCDLSAEYIKQHNILVLPLVFHIDDVEYDDVNKKQIPTLELFDLMRKGAVPKTSQTNPEVVKDFFVKALNDGYDIFHLSTSLGVTGTHSSVLMAIDDIEKNKETLLTKQNQDYNIVAIDSVTGSGGEGMLLDLLLEYFYKKPRTLEELKNEALRLSPMICHYFTVDDLNYLARGGRISKKKAIVGSLLQIKPMLHMNEQGSLVQIGQALGRKKSIKTLVDYIGKKMIPELNDTIYISQGDCLPDIELLKKEITARFQIKKFKVTLTTPIVAAHTGPGAIGIFFLGKDRLEA